VAPPIFPRRSVFHDDRFMQALGRRKLVLVVDDEHIVAESLVTILNLHNYHAATANSAEEAMALCSGLRPDAVISDVIMGEMNGIQLAYQLSATLPQCKVLLVSGNILTDLLLLESPSVINDFPLLAKPAHPRKILDFLERLSS
jgi:DNA-binding NtrC family response regulator